MGLLEDLNEEGNFPSIRRAWCSVCELIKTLSAEEQIALTARLDNKNITHTSLSQVLKKNGHDISDSTIGRHRRKICQSGAK